MGRRRLSRHLCQPRPQTGRMAGQGGGLPAAGRPDVAARSAGRRIAPGDPDRHRRHWEPPCSRASLLCRLMRPAHEAPPAAAVGQRWCCCWVRSIWPVAPPFWRCGSGRRQTTRASPSSPTPRSSFSQTFIPNPPRLAVDIEGIDLNPALRELVAKVKPDDPNISGIRVGQFAPGVVRLVIDLKQPIAPQVFTPDAGRGLPAPAGVRPVPDPGGGPAGSPDRRAPQGERQPRPPPDRRPMTRWVT